MFLRYFFFGYALNILKVDTLCFKCMDLFINQSFKGIDPTLHIKLKKPKLINLYIEENL